MPCHGKEENMANTQTRSHRLIEWTCIVVVIIAAVALGFWWGRRTAPVPLVPTIIPSTSIGSTPTEDEKRRYILSCIRRLPNAQVAAALEAFVTEDPRRISFTSVTRRDAPLLMMTEVGNEANASPVIFIEWNTWCSPLVDDTARWLALTHEWWVCVQIRTGRYPLPLYRKRIFGQAPTDDEILQVFDLVSEAYQAEVALVSANGWVPRDQIIAAGVSKNTAAMRRLLVELFIQDPRLAPFAAKLRDYVR
jgi:hypothetical protein